MRQTSRFMVMATIGVLVLAGCGRREAPPVSPTPPKPLTPSRVEVRPLGASAYVATASSMSLFIIRASGIISGREGDTGLGQYAQEWAQEQAGIGTQLSFAGRRLNLLPSSTLQPSHDAMLGALTAAPDADRSDLYLRQMRQVLAQGAAVHEAYSTRGDSPTLRPVASMAATIYSRQLVAIRRF